MDETGMEVPSECLMVYKTSLFLDTNGHSQCLDVQLPQQLAAMKILQFDVVAKPRV